MKISDDILDSRDYILLSGVILLYPVIPCVAAQGF